MKNRLLQLSIGLVTTASLTACGGGNNTGSVPTGQTVSAQFLDAAVSNLHYASFSYAGETNAAGNFTCALNEEVTFSIGALALGSAICQRIVTPQTISATISQVPAPAPAQLASSVDCMRLTYQKTGSLTAVFDLACAYNDRHGID